MRRMTVRFLLLVVLLVTFLCGICYSLYRSVNAQPIKVALVVPEDQKDVIIISRRLLMMDSVKNICQFIYPKEQEAKGLFDQGEIQAAVFFAEDFVNDVNYGKNTPVTVLLRNGRTPGADLFRELLNSGLYLIDATEAASYALEDVMAVYGSSTSVADAQDQLMADYIKDALYTRGAIQVEVLSATGEVEVTEYYAVLLLLLLLLLCGIQFSVLYDPRDDLIESRLRVYGAGNLFCTLCRIFLMTTVFWLLGLLCLLMLKMFGEYTGFFEIVFSAYMVIGFFFLALSVACLFHGMFSLGINRKNRKLLSALVIACMLILSGCLVPLPYLRQIPSVISVYLPFTAYRNFLEQLLFHQDLDVWPLVYWNLIFLLIGFLSVFKRGNVSEEQSQREGLRAFFWRYQGKGICEYWLRFWLFLKRQWKRKTPLVTVCFALLLLFLCQSISFPDKAGRDILICGADEDMIEAYAASLLHNSCFRFAFQEDEMTAKEAVLSGDVLAAGVERNGEFTIYTAAYAPSVMAAKETMAAMLFAEHQDHLLQLQCERIYGAEGSDICVELNDCFKEYMCSDELLRIIYQQEEEKQDFPESQ